MKKNIYKINKKIFYVRIFFLKNIFFHKLCGGAKTWALALGLSPTFYQQYVREEEIMGEPRN